MKDAQSGVSVKLSAIVSAGVQKLFKRSTTSLELHNTVVHDLLKSKITNTTLILVASIASSSLVWRRLPQ